MTIDKQALRKAAIAATGGKWVFSRSGANSNVQAPIELQKGGRALVVLCKLNNAGWSGQIQTENNAKFIAVANPETVLALLDELEAAEKRIAELEARTVCLPKLPVLGSNAEWYEGFAAGASGMRNECADAIRAAGIGVKGE
ncbi:ead/Ea22-like family protein [Salmonella enterica subsp. enterica]|nr:ead/Ea22-like family protein [Salmonella enterica subsp. enterica serovar Matopeni]ECD1131934.1 ead/Ea22-like family protein [Salmonella enterica subsp. enterica serovar Matopeni]ECD6686021.1 ead/Ea22-like family protein [Salmonella enterica subsp. enterica serovar Matopeni]